MQTNFIEFSIGPIKTKLNAKGEEKKDFVPPLGWSKITETTITNKSHTNRGVLTGKLANLTVVDFDNMDTFKVFMEAYPQLKTTYMVSTKHGIHMYFKYTPLIKSTTNVSTQYAGIDVRNDGGFVIGSPTTYYSLDGTKEEYKYLGGDIVEFPVYLIDIIKPSCLVNSNPIEKEEVVELDGTEDNKIMLLEFVELLNLDDINDYASWRNLVWSIRSMGSNFRSIAQIMSQKGSTYDRSSFGRTWNSYDVNKSQSITSEVFYSYCQRGNPKKYKELIEKHNLQTISEKIIAKYLTRDFTGIKKFEETSKFTMCRLNSKGDWVIKFRREVEECKHVILFAHLGKGKTAYIKNCLNLHIQLAINDSLKKNLPAIPKYKILFLSSRQSFANFVEGKFSEYGIKNYMNFKKESVISEDRLVIQMESLHKLDKTIKYDAVIIDECSSVFAEMSSTTMLKTLDVYQTLLRVVKDASKVLYCDGFILNNTLDFCRGVKQDGEEIVCVHNTVPSNNREAIQVENGEFDDMVMKKFIVGGKTYVCSTSKTHLKTLEVKIETWLKHCTDKNILKEDREYIFYHSENSKAINNTLKDVNKIWATLRLVGTTPKITVGISYDGKDFDDCFIDASNANGATPRDILQMANRIRHLKSNTMYFTLPTRIMFGKSREALFSTFENYLEVEKDRQKLISDRILQDNTGKEHKDFIEIFKCYMEQADPILKRMLHFNMREKIVSQTNFRTLFLKLMKDMGYIITTIEDKTKRETAEANYVENPVEAFDAIPIVSSAEIQKLKIQQMDDPSKENNDIIDKYFFQSFWDGKTIEETKATIFFELYQNSHKRHVFKNLLLEKSTESYIDTTMKDMQKNETTNSLNMRGDKKIIICELNKLMNLDHSQDTGVLIDKENLTNNVYAYMKNNIKDITTTFKSRVKLCNDETKDNSALFKLLKSIYSGWSSAQLCMVKRNKTYKLTGTNFYEGVKSIRPSADQTIIDYLCDEEE
jgi:hypothetical protein